MGFYIKVAPALSGVLTIEFFSNDDHIVGGGVSFFITTSPTSTNTGDNGSDSGTGIMSNDIIGKF